jgi:hypothetical protein
MVMMIEREEAIAVLGAARLGILKQCIEEAWTKYDKVVRPELPLCSQVGMANTVRELVVQQVRDRFFGIEGVVIHDRTGVGGRFLVEIDRKLILSFKKLTTDFHTTNNPTATSLAFDRQETGLLEADLPRITVGYQLGEYGTSIAGIYIAFCIGDEAVWHYDLVTGSSSIEIEFPRDASSAADEEREENKRRDGKRRKRQGTDDGDDTNGGVTDGE